MVSTPVGYTNNSPMSMIQYVIVKKPSSMKSLRQFLEALDVKHKTSIYRLGTAKSKIKAIILGNT